MAMCYNEDTKGEVSALKRRIFLVALCLMLVASTFIAPMSASAASTKVVRILSVTTNGARLREGPSSSYSVITSLKAGEKVFYLNKIDGAFAYVRTSRGRQGYMYKGFLKAYGACGVSQVYYATGNVHAYKKSGSKIVNAGTLSKYQHVIVFKTKGEWAYVRTLNGKAGYVKLSHLKKAV